MSVPAGRRHHEIDALRALAMLLVVHGHITVAGSQLTAVDTRMGEVLTWFQAHHFRMPLFYLVAGFLAAWLVARLGTERFVRNRAGRVGLPFLIGMVTVAPATTLAINLRNATASDDLLQPWHLWFLSYLMIFYACGVLVAPRLARLGGGNRVRLFLASAWLLPALVVLGTALRQLPGQAAPSSTLVPQPMFLAYYGCFFALGWLLFTHRVSVGQVGRRPWLLAAVALAGSFPVAWGLAKHGPWISEGVLHDGLLVLVGLCSLGALFGLAARHFGSDRPAIRWASDASYWVFLVHMPLVSLSYWAYLSAGLPLPLAYCAVLATVVGLSYGSYGAFVRHSAIGRALHGPVPPRAPARTALRRRSGTAPA